MRIVHIGTSVVPVGHRFGGALQRRITEVAREQARLGHEVVVVSPGRRDAVAEVDGVTVRTIGLRSQRPLRDAELLAKAGRWLRRGRRGGVLHAHGAPLAATFLRRHFDATVHSVDYFRYRGSATRAGHAFYRARLAAFDATLAASRFCAGELTAYFPTLAPRVRVLYNGVNLGQFRPDAAGVARARTELDLPDAPTVVYLGRVCVQKGSDLLIPLARRLRAELPSATVVVAGPPAEFGRGGTSDLLDALARHGVRYLGPVEESLVAGLLGAADVVVLPTRRDEMFGMAALEAVACGAPVVAADLGGIPEAVGSCGLLFRPGDGDAFVERVLTVLTTPGLAAELAAHAQRHTERFSWPVIVRECLDYYDGVLR